MNGPRWLWLAVGLLIAGMVGCKCGEEEKKEQQTRVEAGEAGSRYKSTVSKLPGASQVDVTSVMPRGAAVVLVVNSVDRLADWLESKPWYREARSSPVIDDLVFSDTWFRFSTIKHRIESMSAVRLERAGLKELLSTPTGLAIRNAKKNSDFLLVKQIDLKVQALDRMVEVLNQIHPREGMLTTRDVDGLALRTLRLDDDTDLNYLLFSNLLLMSNSEDYLMQAVALARGKGSKALGEDPHLGTLLRRADQADLVIGLDLNNWFQGEQKPWWGAMLRVQHMVLALRTGDGPRLDVLAELADGNGIDNAACTAGKMIPLDSRMLLGLAQLDWHEVWTNLAARMEKPGSLPPRLRKKITKSLVPSLEKQSVFVLGGVDTSGAHVVPRAALLTRIKPGSQKKVAGAVLELFTFLFGEEPGLRSLDELGGKKIRVMQGERPFCPAYTVLDDWLVVASDGKMIEWMVATSRGKQPSITDVPGFSDKVMSSERPVYAVSYLDCGLFFGDLASYTTEVVMRGKRFDRSTMEETVGPFWKALAKMGRLGGSLTADDKELSGRMVPM